MGSLTLPGEEEIWESNPQPKDAVANCCCHLANTNEDSASLPFTIFYGSCSCFISWPEQSLVYIQRSARNTLLLWIKFYACDAKKYASTYTQATRRQTTRGTLATQEQERANEIILLPVLRWMEIKLKHVAWRYLSTDNWTVCRPICGVMTNVLARSVDMHLTK